MKMIAVTLVAIAALFLAGCSKGPSTGEIRDTLQAGALDFVDVRNVDIVSSTEKGENHLLLEVSYEVEFFKGMREAMEDAGIFGAGRIAQMGRFEKGDVRKGKGTYLYRATENGWKLVEN